MPLADEEFVKQTIANLRKRDNPLAKVMKCLDRTIESIRQDIMSVFIILKENNYIVRARRKKIKLGSSILDQFVNNKKLIYCDLIWEKIIIINSPEKKKDYYLRYGLVNSENDNEDVTPKANSKRD